ncbi:hypothetical protein PBY51_005820 [Eleginops maclovinus]|uniref:Uncharacterized protein n=1 Tax=Eleginops maclovinus TaxID=56733 RepID=A0AAN7WTJ6_ELEMC|nr:hypothetical protein PBY51_005820 [Eleginops maclovinus]
MIDRKVFSGRSEHIQTLFASKCVFPRELLIEFINNMASGQKMRRGKRGGRGVQSLKDGWRCRNSFSGSIYSFYFIPLTSAWLRFYVFVQRSASNGSSCFHCTMSQLFCNLRV